MTSLRVEKCIKCTSRSWLLCSKRPLVSWLAGLGQFHLLCSETKSHSPNQLPNVPKKTESSSSSRCSDPILQFVLLQRNPSVGLKPWEIPKEKDEKASCEFKRKATQMTEENPFQTVACCGLLCEDFSNHRMVGPKRGIQCQWLSW